MFFFGEILFGIFILSDLAFCKNTFRPLQNGRYIIIRGYLLLSQILIYLIFILFITILISIKTRTKAKREIY